MGSLNKTLLIGRLGGDPEKRVTPAGHSVVNLSLATTERYKDQRGGKQEKTEWHRLVFWNHLAELVEQYCKKGSQLFVEGSLQTREWQDKDGNRRFNTEIVVRNLQFLDSRPLNQGEGSYGGYSGQGQYSAQNVSGQSSGTHPQGGQTSDAYPYSDGYSAPAKTPNETPTAAPASQASESDDFIEDDMPF